MGLRATSRNKPYTQEFLNGGRQPNDDDDYRNSPDLQDEFADEGRVNLLKKSETKKRGWKAASAEPDEDADYPIDESDPSKNGFLLEELGQVPPPQYPFRWSKQPEDKRPASPFVEYVRSPYPIPMQVLCFRWDGLVDKEEIEESYQTNDWLSERMKYRFEVDKTAIQGSLLTDADFRKTMINKAIVRFSGYAEQIDADIQAGWEITKSAGAGAAGYIKAPLSIKSKLALMTAGINVDNALMTRIGVATQIHEMRANVQISAHRSVRDFLLENDEEYAQLQKITGAVRSRFASKAHELPEGSKVIDVTAEITDTILSDPMDQDDP
jgi:hypothetical protein